MQIDFYSSNVSPAYPWVIGVAGLLALICACTWVALRFLAGAERIIPAGEPNRLVEWRERVFAIGFLTGIVFGGVGVIWLVERGDAQAEDATLQRILESDFSITWDARLQIVRFKGGPGPKTIELLGRSTNAGAQGLEVAMSEVGLERFRAYLAHDRPELVARVEAQYARTEEAR